MPTASKPIHLYGHAMGPNPWKVVIILEELGLPYTTEFMDLAVLHQPPFEKLNPNGRVPVITDPNTGITLWESGAIIEYLVDTYDSESKLTYNSLPEKFLIKQWLYFQVSGQGPYYGQAAWFSLHHPERVDSAIKRYRDQVARVLGVLDRAVEGKAYLVGDKCTIADLSFLTWDMMIPIFFGADVGQLQIEKNYPHYFAWNKRLMERTAVKKAVAEKRAAMAAEEHRSTLRS